MNRPKVESKRQLLVQQIQKLAPWIEGTLVSTARRCGKERCACHREEAAKHAVLSLTWKEAGKTVCLYIPRRLEPEVRQWAAHYKSLKDLIRQISDIQKQIIRLKE